MNLHRIQYFLLLILHCVVGQKEERIVGLINSKRVSWKAQKLPGELYEQLTFMDIWTPEGVPPKIMASIPFKYHKRSMSDEELPKSFDTRNKWPMCRDVISHIRHQGSCGSCWGVAIASVISDRICIGTNGKIKFNASAEDILTCCSDCSGDKKHPCRGGTSYRPFWYWRDYGVVSGGELNSGSGCMPYTEELFHKKENKTCHHQCTNPNYGIPYEKDKSPRATVVYKLPYRNPEQMRQEIFDHGPLYTTFTMFKDFNYYKNGVYEHEIGNKSGAHAVKIIGWGEENGKKYWLAANSWGPKWGMNGFFKILRGENHANVELDVRAGKITELSSRDVLETDDFIDGYNDGKSSKSSWMVSFGLLMVALGANKLMHGW